MQMSFTTDRLVLNILPQTDAHKVLAFYENNKEFFETWEPARDPNFYTLSYQRLTLSIEYNLILQSKILRYWVSLPEDPQAIIGTVNFYNILRGCYSSCQIGYKFDHNYNGKGYAYESIQACLNVLFHEYHLHRIEASIMPSNLPSIKLANKLGFNFEGLAISSIQVNGKWEDHARYAYINYED